MKKRNEKGGSGMESIPPELVEQAKAGDQAAFTELYERTSTMVYRTIRSMVRDEDQVWDIQQDSYLRAWRSLDKLEVNESFVIWLRRIAVNTAATALSKRTPLSFTDLTMDEDDGEPEIPDLNVETQPELALDRKETSRLVRELLAELSPAQQAVVGMYYYEDMPVKDIAELLHVTPSTVKNQLSRGRKKVEAGVRALEKQGVKLYGLSPMPFLLALLGRLEPSAQAEKKVLSSVLEQAPAVPVTVTALTAGQAFLKGLGTKLLAAALAVTFLVVGGKLAYDALHENKLPPVGDERPTAEETVAPSEPVTPSKFYAPDDAPENACGPNLTWSFEEATGTLTIEGSGEMYDYEVATVRYRAPWYDFQDRITAIALPEGLSSIGSAAFSWCAGPSTVTIPEGVSVIGPHAFFNCTGLRSMELPQGLRAIEESAFRGCTGLMTISIPNSVSFIGKGAFFKCSRLRGVVIPEGVTAIEEAAFDQCSMLTSVTIPKSVTSIGEYAFFCCEWLTSVTIPEGVTFIGECAFSGCYVLDSVTIPEGVTSIGEEAFSYCYELDAVTIPASVTSIGDNAFGYINQLERFSVDPGNPYFFSDDDGVLYDKEQTTLLAFPSGKSGTFTIPDSVTAIEEHAFAYCDLSAVTIPDSVTSIGNGAFVDSWKLTSLKIPKSVISIGEGAFWYCENLKAFTVDPENAYFAADDKGVLYDKEQTTLIAVPGGKKGAFKVSEGVTAISNFAFGGCTGLTSVTIPEGVISIGKYAFEYCTGLKSVRIPQSLSSIDIAAFKRCTGLEAFSAAPGNEAFSVDENGVLYNKDKTTLIAYPFGKEGAFSIPDSVTAIGAWAFAYSEGLTDVTIPESVTSIGYGAFGFCSGLSTVTIPASVTSIEEAVFHHAYLTIRGAAGSEAERYAAENWMRFEAIP